MITFEAESLVGILKTYKKKSIQSELAFNGLYERYFSGIYHSHQASFVDKQILIDIINDCFVKVYNKIDTFDDNLSAFSTWLYAIVKNAIIDYKRKKVVHVDPTPTEGYIEANNNNDDESVERLTVFDKIKVEEAVEVKIICREERSQVQRMVKKLDAPYFSKVIELRYFDGLEYSEIAKELKIPLGSVKAYIYKAKLKLRSLFESCNGAE